MKKFFSLILLLSFSAATFADLSSWKIHPIFDEEVRHVVETPDYVYFTSKNMKNASYEVFESLFRYDKKGDELLPLSTSNILNANSVRDVVYNPDKGYLAVLYKNYHIDLLYNNGSVTGIPYYEQSNLTMPKNVNSMTIDNAGDRIYLSTDFGYIAINDKKHEIAESRIYSEPLQAFCRLGDDFLAISGDNLISAPVSSPRLSLDQYETVESFDNPYALYPVADSYCILITGESNPRNIIKVTKSSSGYEFEELHSSSIHNIENSPSGLLIATSNSLLLLKPDGSETMLTRPENYRSSAAYSANMNEIWVGAKRKGLTSLKKGNNWSVTRNWMLPNAPATYVSTSYLNHPSEGFLMLDYGYSSATLNLSSSSPMQLSGYKQGRWTNYAPAYTNTSRYNAVQASNGMLMDPENKNYIYITSYHDGIWKLNLNDPMDIIHMAREGHPDADNSGFVVLPPTQNIHKGYWNISAPYYDAKGNMWMYFANWDDEEDPNPHYYVWLADDRKATTTSNVQLPKEVEFDAYFPQSNASFGIPLLKTGNGLIVHVASVFNDILAMFDTNGTPTDTSDDNIYYFHDFTDSDGNTVDIGNTKYLWEDPATGYVWICHRNGVCYFVPSQVRQGNYTLYRLKVARNDGTNLADYLLDGVTVNHMAVDDEGRKWFATGGGGVVCTSADGREILEEFTTENSPLPDDYVYGIGYNSANNSLMFSTSQGYAEYSLPVSSTSSTKEDVRAYPNPVRPSYSGYVTITDIPQGSFVKIADAGGNLVKELGVMSGFEILWDLSDANFNRVKSGVYYILISPSDENSKYSTVGKILVVS